MWSTLEGVPQSAHIRGVPQSVHIRWVPQSVHIKGDSTVYTLEWGVVWGGAPLFHSLAGPLLEFFPVEDTHPLRSWPPSVRSGEHSGQTGRAGTSGYPRRPSCGGGLCSEEMVTHTPTEKAVVLNHTSNLDYDIFLVSYGSTYTLTFSLETRPSPHSRKIKKKSKALLLLSKAK